MRLRNITIILLSCFFIGLTGWVLAPLFAGRTMHTVAKSVSGLDITEEYNATQIIDEWSPNGDGEVFIEIPLRGNQFSRIAQESKILRYAKCPIVYNGSGAIPIELLKITKGQYLLEVNENDSRTYNLTVLDSINQKLFVYVVIM